MQLSVAADEEEVLLSFLHASTNKGTDVAPTNKLLINFARDCSMVILIFDGEHDVWVLQRNFLNVFIMDITLQMKIKLPP